MEFQPNLIIQGIQLPLALGDFKLIAFDMDSTLINIECIDEIAELVGKKKEVSDITDAAMRGDITDYKESLRLRVAMLKGIPASTLSDVYQNKLRFNPGAENLVSACQKAGMKILLVSGGFTYFTDRVRDHLGIDFTRSNVLEIDNGFLTGRMADQPWGSICDGEEKKRMLIQTCSDMGISLTQSIAMGDGANDLPMMSVAGLSVAYCAKPIVREQANVAILEGGLDRLLAIFQPPD